MQQSELGALVYERRRKEIGMGQTELAFKAWCIPKPYNHLATGRVCKVDCFKIFHIADALGVDPRWLKA
uniref:8 kDa n=1 Tax=Salmonella phage MB78 TaxID=52971 RepID=Q9T0Q2_9CAUD|nr:8 kDA [Salmonella phage MB78]CAB64780.1 gp7 [Salmonella phage MB78]